MGGIFKFTKAVRNENTIHVEKSVLYFNTEDRLLGWQHYLDLL